MDKVKQHENVNFPSPVSKSVDFADTFIKTARNIGFSSSEIERLLKYYSHTKRNIND